jgi:glycerophosphoryl diester phosphodiesterase
MLAVLAATVLAVAAGSGSSAAEPPLAELEARAVLPANTFAAGPPSGGQLGTAPVNGVTPPFASQPVQGLSAALRNDDGTYLAMPDNGYGSIENSADFDLRVYRIRPNVETAAGGPGTVDVLGFFELRDPDKKIPWAITNFFTADRILTGADFDIESMQRVADGTFWFGDEFGPFLLHTDATGKLLDAPVPLPDFDNPGKQIRSPQNPLNEEATAVRIMNAVRTHARLHGDLRAPVFSPEYQLLDDGDPTTFVDHRQSPPAGSGLPAASSEIFNVASIQSAGYPVVTWTVDDKPQMLKLLKLGVSGIISDRPDLLYQAVSEFDANGDGKPGDFLAADGLIDPAKFDAQAHRGGRDLRPENTLPSMEVGLDNLMTTLETDTGVTKDGISMISHDPYVQATKCRKADGSSYTPADDILIKNLTAAQIQSTFVCDKVFRGPTQENDPALSPVAVAFAAAKGLPNPYVMPTLQQLFDFVSFYVDYYKSGAGKSTPNAEHRWKNAERVRFNIETKLNPRTDKDPLGNVYTDRTVGPDAFVTALAGTIAANHLEERADVQSFDFRTLLLVQERFPKIRTVYLFGDFPTFDDQTIAGTDDGTNLQPQGGPNSPWLAGLFWPYRSTTLAQPFRAQRSGGFEGMALSTDGKTLLPLLEKSIGNDPKTILVHPFDLATKSYTGTRYAYRLEAQGTSIGDFQLFDPTHGYVIERDESQGDLAGFKRVYEIRLNAPGAEVTKTLAVDLLNIADPHGISLPVAPGDVGLGNPFAFPFQTIEDIVPLDPTHVVLLDDNNFPFSSGRHKGAGLPDDNELIVLRLDRNIAPDGDIESDPGLFFTTAGPGRFSWATDAVHSPGHSLKLVSDQGSASTARWLGRQSLLPVVPGTRYDVSAWLKTAGVTAGHAELDATFFDSRGVYLDDSAVASSTQPSGTVDWTLAKLTATAPAGAATMRLELRLVGPGTLWVDDLVVKELGDRTAPATGNLAPDPDLEQDPAATYSGDGNATFTWAGDAAHSPTHSLKLVSTQGSDSTARWLSKPDAVAVSAGSEYTVSAWLRTAGVTAGHAELDVTFFDAGGDYIDGSAVQAPTTPSGTTDWTLAQLTAAAPAGAATMRLEFRLVGPGTLWVDDVAARRTGG